MERRKKTIVKNGFLNGKKWVCSLKVTSTGFVRYLCLDFRVAVIDKTKGSQQNVTKTMAINKYG
jgi:hypothetical protein